MQKIKKQNLPVKICQACQKQMIWRKKWEKNWENVKYCSERCKNAKKQTAMIELKKV